MILSIDDRGPEPSNLEKCVNRCTTWFAIKHLDTLNSGVLCLAEKDSNTISGSSRDAKKEIEVALIGHGEIYVKETTTRSKVVDKVIKTMPST